MAVVEKTWFEKNQKTIVIVGLVVLAGLLFLPDVLIKRYVPFVE